MKNYMVKERIIDINNKLKAKKGITYYDLICENDKEMAKEVAICKLNGRNHELGEIIEEDGEVSLIGIEVFLYIS